MATFNIPGSLITANVLKVSLSRQPGVNFHGAVVTLTNPNNDWPDTVDNTRHIKQWGFQQSEDDINWEWGPVYAGDMNNPEVWLPFGLHPKDNPALMPNVGISCSEFVGGTGTRLRLAILTDANIRLGAQIVTT